MAEPVAGLAQHESTISGHLFGNDGKPMLAANVVLSGTVNTTSAPGALYPEDFALVRINADGSFKISTDTLGAFCLMFTGIGHKMMQVPLILERPVNLQIEAHLEILRLIDDFSQVEVCYNFDEEQHGRTASMKEIAPRVYSVELSTDKPEFMYRFLNIGGYPCGESVLEQVLIPLNILLVVHTHQSCIPSKGKYASS
jgi:hypothetical protein